MQQLIRSNQDFKALVESLKDEVKKRNTLVEQLSNDLSSAKESRKILLELYNNANGDMLKFKRENESLSDQIRDKDAKIEELTCHYNNVRGYLQTSKQENDSLLAQIKECNLSKELLAHEMAVVHRSNLEMNGEIKLLKREAEEKDAKILELTYQCTSGEAQKYEPNNLLAETTNSSTRHSELTSMASKEKMTLEIMHLQNDAKMKDVKIQELTCKLQKTERECIDLKTKMNDNMWKEKSQSHHQQDTEELKTLLDTLEKMQSICTQALSRKQGTTQENVADESCFLKPRDPGPEHMEAIAVNQDNEEEISVDQMSFKSEVMEDN